MYKSRKKSFIGGLVIGFVIGLLAGGFTVACVLGTAFIDFAFKNTPDTAQYLIKTK